MKPEPLSSDDNCVKEFPHFVYSAETAKSRNYTSPREGKFQQVGQSQSCVIYDRSEIVQRNITRKAEKLYPWKEDVFTIGSFSKEQ